MSLAEETIKAEKQARDERELEQFRADAERLTAAFFERMEREATEEETFTFAS